MSVNESFPNGDVAWYRASARRRPSPRAKLLVLVGGLALGLTLACTPSPLSEADEFYHRGYYDIAAQRYLKLEALDKADDAVRKRAALAFAWSGRLKEAEPLLQSLLARPEGRDPDLVATWIDVLAITQGQKQAEAEALKALAEFPKSADVIRAAGTLAAQRGELEEARELFNRALTIDARNAAAVANLGDLQLKMKDYPGAVKRYQEAIMLQPASPLSVRLRVQMSRIIAESSPEQALGILQEALSLAPDSGEVNAELGKVLSAIGMCPVAIDHLRAAVDSGLDRPDLLSTLGYCYLSQGTDGDRSALASARKWFERLLAREPKWRGAHTNLGMASLYAGDNESAEASFREELALYPNSVEALSNLGRLLNEQGKGDEARELLERAFGLDRRQVVLASELGGLSMQRSDYPKALEWYNKAYLLCQEAPPEHPCHIEVPYALARLAARQKDKANGARLFLEAVRAGFSDLNRFRAEPELKLLETDSDVAAWINQPR